MGYWKRSLLGRAELHELTTAELAKELRYAADLSIDCRDADTIRYSTPKQELNHEVEILIFKLSAVKCAIVYDFNFSSFPRSRGDAFVRACLEMEEQFLKDVVKFMPHLTMEEVQELMQKRMFAYQDAFSKCSGYWSSNIQELTKIIRRSWSDRTSYLTLLWTAPC